MVSTSTFIDNQRPFAAAGETHIHIHADGSHVMYYNPHILDAAYG